MERGLAFVQFLIISLGVFALHLLIKLHHEEQTPELIVNLARFLGRYALWMLAIPIVWAIVGTGLKARLGKRITNIVGIALTIAVFLIFAVPLCWYLG